MRPYSSIKNAVLYYSSTNNFCYLQGPLGSVTRNAVGGGGPGGNYTITLNPNGAAAISDGSFNGSMVKNFSSSVAGAPGSSWITILIENPDLGEFEMGVFPNIDFYFNVLDMSTSQYQIILKPSYNLC